MNLVAVMLLMLLFPLGSFVVQALLQASLDNWILLIGRWFGFWMVGIRLLLAGMRQAAQPDWIAQQMFDIKSNEALPIVQQSGFANIAMGAVGTLSVFGTHWIVPSALMGAIFYGCTGIRHLRRKNKNRNQMIATISDVFAATVLVAYLILSQI